MPRPVKPDVVKKRITQLVHDFTEHNVSVSRGQRGVVQSHICKAWPDEKVRHACLSWIFDSEKLEHMSQLTDAQVMALKRWIGTLKVGDAWLPERGWETEAQWVEFTVFPAAPPSPAPAEPEPTPEDDMTQVEFLLHIGANITSIEPDPDYKEPDGYYTFDGE